MKTVTASNGIATAPHFLAAQAGRQRLVAPRGPRQDGDARPVGGCKRRVHQSDPGFCSSSRRIVSAPASRSSEAAASPMASASVMGPLCVA